MGTKGDIIGDKIASVAALAIAWEEKLENVSFIPILTLKEKDAAYFDLTAFLGSVLHSVEQLRVELSSSPDYQCEYQNEQPHSS